MAHTIDRKLVIPRGRTSRRPVAIKQELVLPANLPRPLRSVQFAPSSTVAVSIFRRFYYGRQDMALMPAIRAPKHDGRGLLIQMNPK